MNMTIPNIDLDNTSFQEIIDRVREKLPLYSKDYTDYNISDPCITLLELFAWMADTYIYKLDIIPQRNYLKFLKLLGGDTSLPRPPNPSKVQITFSTVDKNNTEIVYLKSGTKLKYDKTKIDDTTFETDYSFHYIPAKVQRILINSKDGVNDKTIELLPSIESDKETEDTLGSFNNKNYQYLFGDNPLIGNYLSIGFSFSTNIQQFVQKNRSISDEKEKEPEILLSFFLDEDLYVSDVQRIFTNRYIEWEYLSMDQTNVWKPFQVNIKSLESYSNNLDRFQDYDYYPEALINLIKFSIPLSVFAKKDILKIPDKHITNYLSTISPPESIHKFTFQTQDPNNDDSSDNTIEEIVYFIRCRIKNINNEFGTVEENLKLKIKTVLINTVSASFGNTVKEEYLRFSELKPNDYFSIHIPKSYESIPDNAYSLFNLLPNLGYKTSKKPIIDILNIQIDDVFTKSLLTENKKKLEDIINTLFEHFIDENSSSTSTLDSKLKYLVNFMKNPHKHKIVIENFLNKPQSNDVFKDLEELVQSVSEFSYYITESDLSRLISYLNIPLLSQYTILNLHLLVRTCQRLKKFYDKISESISNIPVNKISDFDLSSPYSLDYKVDYVNGVVIFGDGIKGKLPPRGALIKIDYRYGFNQTIKSKEGLLFYLINSNGNPDDDNNLIGYNYLPSTVGKNSETISDAIQRQKMNLNKIRKAVTSKDYENICQSIVGVKMSKVLRSKNKNNPSNQLSLVNNRIRIVIQPTKGDKASEYVKEKIMGSLADLRLITTSIDLIDPKYVKIHVEIVVKILSHTDPEIVKESILSHLQTFFQNLTFGKSLYKSEIYSIINNVPGVDYISSENYSLIPIGPIGSYIHKNGNVLLTEDSIFEFDKENCKITVVL